MIASFCCCCIPTLITMVSSVYIEYRIHREDTYNILICDKYTVEKQLPIFTKKDITVLINGVETVFENDGIEDFGSSIQNYPYMTRCLYQWDYKYPDHSVYFPHVGVNWSPYPIYLQVNLDDTVTPLIMFNHNPYSDNEHLYDYLLNWFNSKYDLNYTMRL